jgi:Fe2+ or Zn2+ uptake regulation protein
LSCQDILDRLRAEFSNMSVEKLYRHVEESYLLQVLTILNQLVLSGIIHDMDVGGGR